MIIHSAALAWPGPIKAPSRHTAVQLIENRLATHIELEYAGGWKDVEELADLATPHGITVSFRATESVSIPSVEALQQILNTRKETYRHRFLLCEFDMESLPHESLCEFEDVALERGDIILPDDFFADFGTEAGSLIH